MAAATSVPAFVCIPCDDPSIRPAPTALLSLAEVVEEETRAPPKNPRRINLIPGRRGKQKHTGGITQRSVTRPRAPQPVPQWPPDYPRRKLRVLDLCCGTKSVEHALRGLCGPDRIPNKKRRGVYRDRYEYVSLDIEPRWKPSLLGSVLRWKDKLASMNPEYTHPGYWDVIWASPPCAKFSRTQGGGATPEEIALAAKLVKACREAIEELAPAAWYLENSWNALRHHPVVRGLPAPIRLSYCIYGTPYQKDTMLYTNVPGLVLETCRVGHTCVWKKQGHVRHRDVSQGGPSLHKKKKRRYNGTPREEAYVVPGRLMDVLMSGAVRLAISDLRSGRR